MIIRDKAGLGWAGLGWAGLGTVIRNVADKRVAGGSGVMPRCGDRSLLDKGNPAGGGYSDVIVQTRAGNNPSRSFTVAGEGRYQCTMLNGNLNMCANNLAIPRGPIRDLLYDCDIFANVS